MATVINTVFPASLLNSLHEFGNDCKEYLSQWKKKTLYTYKESMKVRKPSWMIFLLKFLHVFEDHLTTNMSPSFSKPPDT